MLTSGSPLQPPSCAYMVLVGLPVHTYICLPGICALCLPIIYLIVSAPLCFCLRALFDFIFRAHTQSESERERERAITTQSKSASGHFCMNALAFNKWLIKPLGGAFFWRIWLPNSPGSARLASHRVSVWSIKCDVMFYIGQVILLLPLLLLWPAAGRLTAIN